MKSHRGRCIRLAGFLLALIGSVVAAQTQSPPRGLALVVGISRFADAAISPLPGIENDVAVARKIASYIGISASGTVVLSDERATANAVRSQLARIARQVSDHEKVFIYFSTHGSRWMNATIGKCDESLVFFDGEHITKDELAELLKPIAQRAYKLFLFIDSCHSGGFTVARSVDSKFVPKFYRDIRTTDSCQTAVNDLADKISPVPPRSRGIGPNNVVVVTAARQNEYSLHRVDIGGLATHAWAQCAFGKATDDDRSGAISFAEVEACAQRDIEKQLEGVREYKAHHITTQGVRDLPLSLLTAAADPVSLPERTTVAIAPPIVQMPAVQAPIPPVKTEPNAPLLQAPAPPMRQAVTLPSTPLVTTPTELPYTNTLTLRPPTVPDKDKPVQPIGPAATLRDIVAMSDGRWGLDVEVPTRTLEIKKDFLSLRLRSQHPGFVYMLAVGSDNKTVDILFPNRVDKRNTISAGEELTLPRLTWRLRAQGPPGTNRILVIVAETERNIQNNSFGDLAGVFLSARPDQSTSLQRGLYTGSIDGNGKCKGVDGRNLVVETACTPRFAARLIEVQEVMTP